MSLLLPDSSLTNEPAAQNPPDDLEGSKHLVELNRNEPAAQSPPDDLEGSEQLVELSSNQPTAQSTPDLEGLEHLVQLGNNEPATLSSPDDLEVSEHLVELKSNEPTPQSPPYDLEGSEKLAELESNEPAAQSSLNDLEASEHHVELDSSELAAQSPTDNLEGAEHLVELYSNELTAQSPPDLEGSEHLVQVGSKEPAAQSPPDHLEGSEQFVELDSSEPAAHSPSDNLEGSEHLVELDSTSRPGAATCDIALGPVGVASGNKSDTPALSSDGSQSSYGPGSACSGERVGGGKGMSTAQVSTCFGSEVHPESGSTTAQQIGTPICEEIIETEEVEKQMQAINIALEATDFGALQELAFSRLGFCSPDLRRRAWLTLLGLSDKEAQDASWHELLAAVEHDNKQAKVMKADVARAVYSWDVHVGIEDVVRDQKRTQLSEVMHATLQRHGKKLAYFQGFHDVVLVFLEVGSPSEAYHMIERLALFHLSDQLCWPFDMGLMPLLKVLFYLVQTLDLPVAQALHEADCSELHFAVPWVLTWFSHSLPHLHGQVMQLFDCLISSHPTMILYFAAQLLLEQREQLLNTSRELPEMVLLLQNLPYASLDVPKWAERTWQLSKQLPPETLMYRLPRQIKKTLPYTSPLFHYPHPWISRPKKMRSLTFMSERRSVFELAPIYAARPSLCSRLLEAFAGMLVKLRHCARSWMWMIGALCVLLLARTLTKDSG